MFKSFSKRWIVLVGLLILSLATYVTLRAVDRFYVVEQQLLANAEFQQESQHWEGRGSATVSYSNSQVDIENQVIENYGISQRVAVKNPMYVRVIVDVGSEAIVPGDKEWAGGGVAVIFFDKNGEWVKQQTLAPLRGTHPIAEYSLTDYVDEKIAEIEISIRLLNATGKYTARSPRLQQLEQNAFYKAIRIAIVIGWILIGLTLLAFLARQFSLRFLIPVTLALGFSLIGFLLPDNLVIELGKKMSIFAPTLNFEWLGHFIPFLAIGLFCGFVYKQIGMIFGIASLAVFAVLTESLQMLMNGRSSSFEDIGIDMLGGGVGVIIGAACALAVSGLVLLQLKFKKVSD